MESWANGTFSASFEVEMLVKNAGATGFCDAMQTLINLDHSDLEQSNE